jgi:tryptophan synthase alpha subunit
MAKPDLSEFFEKPKKNCIAGQLISKLPTEERLKVEAALEEPSIDAASIVRFIQKRGVDAKHPSVLRHRKKECNCYGQ